MNKVLVQKLVFICLALIALGVTYYLYQKKEISFLPQKKERTGSKGFTIQLSISENDYRLSYKDKVGSTVDVANFESNENWFGDGEFDYSTLLEGESSLFVTSLDGKKSIVSLNKSINIKNVNNFKLSFFQVSEPENIERFDLVFSGEKWGYRFPIRDLDKGWNLLFLPKEKFSVLSLSETSDASVENSVETEEQEEIKKISIELTSRPKTRSSVNLDSLWAETEKEYQNDWSSDGEKFLSLRRIKNQSKLLAIGQFGSLAVLKKGSASDYVVQTEFTPLREGAFGFFLRGDYKSGYGYYLLMGGINTDAWRIYKYGSFEEKIQNINLIEGRISNFKVEKERSYWLKAEMKGNQIKFYFSTDNKNFTKLGEVNDASFSSGGVGIASFDHSMFFVDDLRFFK